MPRKRIGTELQVSKTWMYDPDFVAWVEAEADRRRVTASAVIREVSDLGRPRYERIYGRRRAAQQKEAV